MAAALLMTIPTAIVFMVFQRHFTQGANAGAEKGFDRATPRVWAGRARPSAQPARGVARRVAQPVTSERSTYCRMPPLR